MGQTNQSVVIDTISERVWAAIRDFHDLGWAPNVIQDVEWSSSWERNDEAGHDFCAPIYVALLNDMKANLE